MRSQYHQFRNSVTASIKTIRALRFISIFKPEGKHIPVGSSGIFRRALRIFFY